MNRGLRGGEEGMERWGECDFALWEGILGG